MICLQHGADLDLFIGGECGPTCRKSTGLVFDLMISGKDVRQFEDDYDLFRRISGGTGGFSPYDWEGMYVTLLKRVHENGLPETQAELIAELQDWFVEVAENGDIPDESTIRRRLRPFWRALRGKT